MSKYISITFFLLLSHLGSYAQTYPVTATTQLTPPYSVYLADYVAPGSDRLALNVFLGDVNRPELQVKLRLRIEGQGIIIETKPEYQPPPIILQGGIPQRLIAADLVDYLNANSLNFQGITRQQFERTGALPEGLYQFCFEVLEYNRGVKISNTSCAMAWMILNDPPIINLPKQGEKLRPQDPQFITFQWTPRHTGSPNAAFSTEYEFSMVELWPDTRNPNDAILTMPPIHQVTTQSTTLIYGPAETPLMAGRRYAFRVQAKSILGAEQLDLFKNNGYSETYTFTYGDACTLPTNISAEAINAAKFKVKWAPNYNHSSFSVRYRLANTANAQWYEEDSFFDEVDITDLQPETTYEYQVSGSCGAFSSEFSSIGKVTTASMPEINFTCGLPPVNFQMDNTTPIEELKVGDIIHSGDFEVKVITLTPSGATYNGTGTVLVPYLDNLMVSVDFASIEVNTDYRLFKGSMNVTGIGLDIIPPELSALLDQLDEGLAQIDDLLGEISAGLEIASEILDAVGDLANDIMDNGPFTADEEAQLEGLTVKEYNTKAKEALADAVSEMANAKLSDNYDVVARKVAQALTLKKRGSKLKKIYDSADTLQVVAVEFYENVTYGFDAQKYPQHRLHYNIMVTDSTDATTNTPIPWAAVKAGEATTVKARLLPDKGIASGDIIFKTAEGNELSATRNGNEWTVQLPLMTNDQELTINAINSPTNETVGKLQAIGYTPIEKKVVLVSVNGVTGTPDPATLTTYLNTVYKQAVASWTVEIGAGLQVDSFDGTLQDDEQATLSTYSEGMKDIIRAFKRDTTSFDKDAFYLFLVDKSSTGNAGYMPREHRYGFIYMGEAGDKQQTIAHELGHGAFRLQHTWEEYPGIAEGTSQNLMDYAGGTTLRKYQWDLIHNPPLVIGLLEDISEGSQLGKSVQHCATASMLNNFGTNNNFFNPAGEPIDLETAVPRSFYALEEEDTDLVGRLASFTKDGKIYKAYVTNGKFKAYGHDPRGKLSLSGEEFENIKYEPKPGSNASGQLVKIDKDCNYTILIGSSSNGPLQSSEECNCTDNTLSGPGKSFYEAYYSTAKTDEERTQIEEIAKLYDELGEVLLSDYSDEAWAAQKPFYSVYYDGYGEWSYTYEEYKNALQKYMDEYKKNIDLLKTVNAQDRAVSLLKNLSDKQLESISDSLRIKAIKVLTSESMTGDVFGLFNTNEEVTAIRLIETIPINGFNTFISKFENSGLLVKLDYRLDDIGWPYNDDNYLKFIKTLTKKNYEANPITDAGALVLDLYNNDKIFWWGSTKTFPMSFFGDKSCPFVFESELSKDGLKITVKEPIGTTTTFTDIAGSGVDIECVNNQNQISLDPFDYIVIYPDSKSVLAESLGLNKGEIKILPAISLHYLINEKSNEVARTAIGVTVDVALFFVGVGEIKAAATALHRTLAIIEVVASASDIALNIFEEDVINAFDDPEEGKLFVDSYRSMVLIIGVLNIGSSIYDSRIQKILKTDGVDVVRLWDKNAVKLQGKLGDKFSSYDEFINEIRRLTDDVASAGAALLVSVKQKFPNISPAWFDDVSEGLLNKLDDLATNNQSLVAKFEADINANPNALKTLFNGNPNSVNAWKAVNHLPDAIKLEPSILSKLNDIASRGRGIDLPKLETALKGDLGDVLGGATGDDLTKILNRLDADHVTGSHLDELTSRLGNAQYGIKQDLIDNPGWFETFDDVLQEPGRYWDILAEGNLVAGSPLAKWGQGKWWKNLRDFADNFETGAARSRFQTDLGLDADKIVEQVTLEVNGTKIRIDYLGVDDAGKFHLGDAKFSTKDKNWSSSWLDAATPNQSTVYPLFESGNVNSIVVKVSDSEKAGLLLDLGLANNSTIDFANTSLRIFGSDAGQTTVKSVITIKN